MRKVALDLLEYARGSRNFGPAEARPDDAWLYPIDLEFTLADAARYYSPRDPSGLPIKRYRSVGDQYNPTRVAAFGLSHWNRLHGRGDEASREPFLRVASWFHDTAEAGRWVYRFDLHTMRAPWISCMAQGEGISVLTRAARLTGDERLIAVARAALAPFRDGTADGGVRSHLPAGGVFFEEFTSLEPDHVLNGYLYALIGLLDLNRLAPTEELDDVLGGAREVLERNLHLWDADGWSLYDLHNLAGGGRRNLCTAAYHRLHATQLGYLGDALASSTIRRQAETWARTGGSLAKRLKAASGKIGYRLRYPPQR